MAEQEDKFAQLRKEIDEALAGLPGNRRRDDKPVRVTEMDVEAYAELFGKEEALRYFAGCVMMDDSSVDDLISSLADDPGFDLGGEGG